MRLLTLCVALSVPSLVLAQTDALDRRDASRGLTLPPTTSTLIEDSTAPALNPAAMTRLDGPQIIYLHERNIATNRVGDGFYLGTSLFQVVGTGLSLEWLRSSTGIDYRKTAWSIAVGGPLLSVGASLNLFSARDSRNLDGLSSVNVGLTAHPWKFLAVGGSVINVESPRSGNVMLPREYRFGVGLRPLGERYTLGIDYVFQDDPGFNGGRFNYALQAEVLQGLLVSAGVSHGVHRNEPVQFQVAATINTAHFGVGYAFGGGGGGYDHIGMARLSMATYRHVELGGGKMAVFDLDDLLASPNSPALNLLGLGSREDPLLRTLELFDYAARDPSLKGVVLKVSRLPNIGLGKAYELREAILKLRAADKKVVAVLLSAEDPEYFVASAAERVFAVPQAFLAVNGLAAHTTFLGEAMRKLGVHWDVARVGKYKSAPDALTRDDLNPDEKEALNAFLDNQAHVYQTEITRSRSLKPQELKKALEVGLQSPERSVALGLVDEVVDPEQLEKRLKEWVPGAHFEPGYAPHNERPREWGLAPKIAVVPILGDIAGGKSREDPLGMQRIAGAETVIAALEQASNDPSVNAIILRIDSGGGDGLASDLMYRAILRAKKKKPVIASLGDAAASGGYYAAMGAHEIWSAPTTLTGSIGVFVLKPALSELAEKLGIHQEILTRSAQADVFGFYRAWTPEEQKLAQQWADDFYRRFIQEVAQSRQMTVEAVDALAQGRIWSGTDALSRHLVDGLGGWEEALSAAKRRAHLPQETHCEVMVMGGPRSALASLAGEVGVQLSEPEVTTLPVAPWLKAIGFPAIALMEPGVKAMMPFQLSIR